MTPTLDGDVLARLAVVERAFTPGQLQAMIGHASVSGVRKVLNRLADQGIVDARPVSKVAITYSLNRDHVAAEAIISLANARDTLYARMRGLIEQWTVPPTYACVFGSWARGQATIDSDIDVFLARPERAEIDTWDGDVAALEHATTRWTGNDARALVLTESVIHDAPRDPVLVSVATEGRDLYGDSGWLRQIVRKGAGR
ncbi:nucleotidyltransferase domain-containing protein [Cellulosimicrobium arenosum]|uniref:nucleotidyltransferase domain-containing protein n=1 Tax=Cellulosimicrobium arenosum TaxID=2708133 RepID=UPI0019D70654